MFDINAGLAISSSAVKKIIKTKNTCAPSSWGMPSFTGKAVLQCCQTTGIEIWDPIDTVFSDSFIKKA